MSAGYPSLASRSRGAEVLQIRHMRAAYARVVDFEAVKAAATPDLVSCAVGAAANAQDLLGDAELLAAAGRRPRAYALPALAGGGAGKAATGAALALMPLSLWAIELGWALVSALADTGYGRTPRAAAGVWVEAVRRLRERLS